MVYSAYTDRRYLLRWVEETDPAQLAVACELPTATLADLYAPDVTTSNPNWVRAIRLKHALQRHQSDRSSVDAIARLIVHAKTVTRLHDDWDRSQLIYDKLVETNLSFYDSKAPVCQVLSEQGFTVQDVRVAYEVPAQLLLVASPREETEEIRKFVDEVVDNVNPAYCEECKRLYKDFS